MMLLLLIFLKKLVLKDGLNMAEIELNVLTGQCLDRRMDDIEFVRKEVMAWEKNRNNKNAKVKWQLRLKMQG
ncbi:hypothetical protein MTYM_02290 [Methylococcales bacterium]|nr:hypothetical protein MTYM_02290 [Methylococcales bacterium]